MEWELFLKNSLFFFALINPASKVFLLASMKPRLTEKEVCTIACRSTIFSFLLLFVICSAGSFILQNIFRVDLYSISVVGGCVLFLIGLKAVTQGVFYEKNIYSEQEDITLVPLATPLIAGPGTIAASISYSAQHGFVTTIICLAMALLMNGIIMTMSNPIGKVAERLRLIGPVIRITGLIVMAMAVQMLFHGVGEWIKSL